MKSGPELLQNESRRSASAFERLPHLYKSRAHIAPDGNPLIIPITNAAAPVGATLNTGRIMWRAYFATDSANPE